MILIVSLISISVLFISFIYYNSTKDMNNNNSDIRTFLLADSIEEDLI
jgi:hypothetical protein